MKKALPALLMLLSAHCFAQTMHLSQPKPAIYVDSALVNESYFKSISPDDILRVDVKRASEFPNGVIYITTKNKQQTQTLLKSQLLSLADIATANLPPSLRSKPVIFQLDRTILTDTAKVRIPALAVRGIIIKEAADTPYFKTALPNVVLLIISTKPPTIFIRGDE